MASTFDAAAAGSTLNSSTVGISLTRTTNANGLLIGVGVRPGDTAVGSLTSVTYAGASLSKLGAVQSGTAATSRGVEVWYLVNPATGANNGTFTFSASNNPYVCSFVSFYGVDQTNPILSVGSSAATSGTIIFGTVTSSINDIIFDALANRGANAGTPGVNQTSIISGSAPDPGTNAQLNTSRMTGVALGTPQYTMATDNHAYFSMNIAASGTAIAQTYGYRNLLGVGI